MNIKMNSSHRIHFKEKTHFQNKTLKELEETE